MPERCVDASVGIKWVVKGEPYRGKARKFLKESLTGGITLIAPPLFEYEIESVIQTKVVRSLISTADADIALQALAAVRVQQVAHPGAVKRAREIARRFNQPKIYDSLYAALAELRACEFWTADKAFYDAVKTALPFVKYLPNYL
ncbi:MAG: type II toxin-antitoxin system VapC family toxin [Blastocatellia bacterium]